jgi:ABC-2 type transport system ATP-binding protein
VIASGTPSELTARGAENTLRFRGPSGLDIRSLQAALPEGTRVSEAAPGNYLIEGKIDPQLLATVTAWCAANGVLPDGLSVERHTLEDVFLELTGRELRP